MSPRVDSFNRSARARLRVIAETTSKGATPRIFTSSEVTVGPNSAPPMPPSAISGNNRRAWPLSKTSAMKLQNSETTNRLNTLTQTKNTVPSARAPIRSWATKAGMKPTRQRMKNP